MRVRSPLLLAALALVVLLVGCIGDGGDSAEPAEQSVPETPGDGIEPPLNFTAPVQLNPDGLYGYEPSIQVGQEGTLYATAHKDSLVHEGDRLASWLWYSTDGGETWEEMPSPAQVHDKLFALEGSLAVDDGNRLYYIDTYGADNTLSRWQGGAEGPTWESSRPVHGTTGADDRPWLAAHGDGVVYYVGNNGPPVPAANNLENPGEASRYWFYASEDAGQTWSAGHGFHGSGWCTLAASPADAETAYVGCNRRLDGSVPGLIGPEHVLTVYRTTDRGASFESVEVDQFEHGLTDGYPNVAVEADGTPYLAWPDGDHDAEAGTEIRYAHPGEGSNWTVHTVTPFEGSFEKVWASAGEDGTLALTFYGTNVTTPEESTRWFAYTMVSSNARADDPTWTIAKVDDRHVAEDDGPPGDFLQNDVGPNDTVHVVYEREVVDPGNDPTHPTHSGTTSNLFHVRQTVGPNLAANGTPLPG